MCKHCVEPVRGVLMLLTVSTLLALTYACHKSGSKRLALLGDKGSQ